MKAIITSTFCSDNLWKSKFMPLEKPGKLEEFFARDSIYAKRAYAIAIPSVYLSVCLCVRHTGGSVKNG